MQIEDLRIQLMSDSEMFIRVKHNRAKNPSWLFIQVFGPTVSSANQDEVESYANKWDIKDADNLYGKGVGREPNHKVG